LRGRSSHEGSGIVVGSKTVSIVSIYLWNLRLWHTIRSELALSCLPLSIFRSPSPRLQLARRHYGIGIQTSLARVVLDFDSWAFAKSSCNFHSVIHLHTYLYLTAHGELPRERPCRRDVGQSASAESYCELDDANKLPGFFRLLGSLDQHHFTAVGCGRRPDIALISVNEDFRSTRDRSSSSSAKKAGPQAAAERTHTYLALGHRRRVLVFPSIGRTG
jgi:hypothetical protein